MTIMNYLEMKRTWATEIAFTLAVPLTTIVLFLIVSPIWGFQI